MPDKKKPKPKAQPRYRKFKFKIFLSCELIIFFTEKIKNNKIEKEKKFIIEKLYGEKPNVVIAPNVKGAKKIKKNLFLSKTSKFKILLVNN